MDWLLSGLIILSNILIGNKKYYGQFLMLLTNLLWVYFALSIKQYGLLPAVFINIGISIYYSYRWFKERSNEIRTA